MEKYKIIEQSIIKKFRPTIWRKFVRAIETYQMIQDGDKIAICISGGKDSMLLAKCMQELKIHGHIAFDFVAIIMNPGYTNKHLQQIMGNLDLLNINAHIFETNIFNVVSKVDTSPCYLCARMRRGYLYNEAQKLQCNKIALGHHFDDVIETILMGMLYGGQIATMMPKLHSTNYANMELIRPLYLVKENDIIAWANYNNLTFLQCACQKTEQTSYNPSSSKRYEVKQLIKSLRCIYSDIDINIFKSVQNINLNTIIGYHNDVQKYHFLDDYNNKKQRED